MKKVLIVSEFSENQYTYASSFCIAFQNLGFKVFKFNCKKNYNSLPFILKQIKNFFINFLLKKKARQINPDIIFFIKADNIYYKTIRYLKNNLKSKLFNFYPDNPFVFWNGNSNRNILLSLPLFDCFLIWSEMLMSILQSAGCKKVYYFPFAFQKDLFPEKLKITEDEKQKYKSDVCFIGTWDKDRQNWLTLLCQKMPELNLSIWGNLWEEYLPPKSILRSKVKGKAIYGHEMVKAFRCSKIVLNFIRKQNATSHNMRTIEVAASKSFLLTEWTKEQAQKLFTENESIVCFNNIDDLVEKIYFYLNNEEQKQKIVAAAFENVKRFEITKVLKDFIRGESYE